MGCPPGTHPGPFGWAGEGVGGLRTGLASDRRRQTARDLQARPKGDAGKWTMAAGVRTETRGETIT